MQIRYTQNNLIINYFLFLFSIIPISILIGPSISLINILIIDISFLFFIIKSKNFSFFKNKNFKYLLILFVYLVFNSIISLDLSLSAARNLGFFRILVLFLAFNYFFSENFFLRKVLTTWAVIFLIVLLDIFVEFFFGQNLLGYNGGIYQNRIVSFFKDEPIVGSYINGFYLIIIGFLLSQIKFLNKNFIIFFSLIILLSVIFTGERSSSIRTVFSLFLFVSFISIIDFKKKIIYFLLGLFVMLIIILNSDFLKYRFVNGIKNIPINQNIYFKIYKSGYEVFKQHPYFGVGNKNYRKVTCDPEILKVNKNKNYLCQTHPHQVYLELLSEHGIFGTFLIFYILYKLIFSKIRKVILNQNYIQMGCMLYLIMIFLPLIPSGAFFGDFLLTLFAINLSLLYSSDSSLNIFNKSIEHKSNTRTGR